MSHPALFGVSPISQPARVAITVSPPAGTAAGIDNAVPDGKDGCRAENTGLPCADVLEYHLKGQNKLIIRPSGTEPKIKVYLSAAGKSNAGVEAINTTLTNAVFNLVKSIASI